MSLSHPRLIPARLFTPSGAEEDWQGPHGVVAVPGRVPLLSAGGWTVLVLLCLPQTGEKEGEREGGERTGGREGDKEEEKERERERAGGRDAERERNQHHAGGRPSDVGSFPRRLYVTPPGPADSHHYSLPPPAAAYTPRSSPPPTAHRSGSTSSRGTL